MGGSKHPREGLHKEQCLSFVQKLWAADTLSMFHHPVSATEVPGYYDVVEVPMDLSTIRKKIEQDKYSTDAEVENDVALMLSNALQFNEKDSQWYSLAKQLKKRYLTLAQECGLSFDADEVFIPTKKVRDDESTLRKAEEEVDEKIEDILESMEKDKEIPLEQLRAMYARRKTEGIADQPSSDYGSSRDSVGSNEMPSDEAATSDDSSSSSSDSDETDEEEEGDPSDSQTASKDDDNE
ncbi:hypothetical protein LSCM1_00316 [Leishmania martiniquensis]|uniref:Bromo domain-containing protein n=1 Tax=Leishmania martiniquensis TaxID=1580590 RepID=A0A836K8N3_9TRYP|nr:hypothetical protein LSCM1_00316 [Leishmania martiniquensis]